MVYHDGMELAGYLSFLIMLVVFPFLVLFMWVVTFLGDGSWGNLLIQSILQSSWARFIDALKPRIIEITSSPPHSLVTLAILSATWTASSLFEGLRTVLNKAYRVSSPPSYILRRLLSFIEFGVAMIITLAFVGALVVIPSILGAIESVLPQTVIQYFEFLTPKYSDLQLWILFIFGFTLISMAYYTLPSRKIKFVAVLPGTIFVVVSWTVFSILFKFYISNFPQVNLIYGSIAGIIIALLYFYICSIIFIIGAELNYQLTKKNL